MEKYRINAFTYDVYLYDVFNSMQYFFLFPTCKNSQIKVSCNFNDFSVFILICYLLFNSQIEAISKL